MKQKSFLSFFSVSLFILCSFFLGQNTPTAEAQMTPITAAPTTIISGKPSVPMSLSVSPTSPGAYEEVKATISSLQFKVDVTPIAWFVNGTAAKTGIGEKTFTFKTGAPGEPIFLHVEADTEEYGLAYLEKTITPGGIDIMWEADTYVPPFYKGKALPSPQSQMKFIALPNFLSKNTSPKNFVYKWGSNSGSRLSGYEKNIFIYRSGYLYGTDTIKVTVTTQDGAASAQKSTPIKVSSPKILFYKNKPLDGVRYDKALGTAITFDESEIVLRAEPYFFSFVSRNYDDDGIFDWRLDGKKLEINADNRSEYILRAPETGSGKVTIKLDIENDTINTQKASGQVTLSYHN